MGIPMYRFEKLTKYMRSFCNQKFYRGQLIVMTKDQNEPDVLAMYRTTAGSHARSHVNQRQIDVIR